MASLRRPSLMTPLGYSSHSCGYCGSTSSSSSKSYGIQSHSITPSHYSQLMLRGWRRSGSYLYKPDNLRTCCPQHTILLNASEFIPSKSQRQLLNRFNQFMAAPEAGAEAEAEQTVKVKAKGKGKANRNSPVSLTELVHAAESNEGSRFEFILEPSSYTREKFDLYRKYQTNVHNDPPGKITQRGFKNFLVESPIESEDDLGSFHGLYRLDGQLIAFSVLDIIPDIVSSVYFVWDPDFAALSLGKVSALREISLTTEFKFKRYMMGFYIHACPKMRYKAEYQPSFLLDSVTNEFYPFDHCKLRLDLAKYASFSTPLESIIADSAANGSNEETSPDWPSPPPPGCLDPDQLDEDLLRRSRTLVITAGRQSVVPLLDSPYWQDPDQARSIRECIAATGESFVGRFWFVF